MKKIALVAGVLALASGCVVAPFQPPMGAVSVVRAPLSTEGDFSASSKSGEASSVSILGIVSTGDCSIDAAVKSGGLKNINHIDYGYLNIIGVFQKTTVYVYGE